MAKDKERSVNPAQQAHKQEKTRALKKAKNEQQARRNERLARQNPQRLQRQIDDLKALESSGEIKPREKDVLADLERDIRAIKKAREALGDKAPVFGNARSQNDAVDSNTSRILGKRGRDDGQRQRYRTYSQDSDAGDETDESVRAIPMPRDTPPPIPYEFRRSHQPRYHHHADTDNPGKVRSLPAPPMAVEQKTTYSAAPQLRDLRKEAISRFVPSAVKKKQDAVKGVGGVLLEPEELDSLEAAGYRHSSVDSRSVAPATTDQQSAALKAKEDEANRLQEEIARFEKELAGTNDGGSSAAEVDQRQENGSIVPSQQQRQRPKSQHQVQIEDVEDEDL